MSEQNGTYSKEMRNFYVAIFLIGLVLFSLMGCEKKEAVKVPTGPCEVYDNLPGDIKKTLDVNFGNKIKLKGITVKRLSENQLSVTYYWQLLNELDTYDTIFVHFTDKDNKGIFQNDHVFCRQKPFEELKGKIVKETFNFDFPKNASGQEIFVKIGLYDLKSRGRLKIASANGIPTDDDNSRAIIESLKL